MTWDRFVSILPILTLALGYIGSLHTERWRDRRDRERLLLDRLIELEQSALVEIQDILVSLPAEWIRAIELYNESLQSDTTWSWDDTDVGLRRNRAVALVSRISDPELRRHLYELIIDEISDDWGELLDRMERREPIEVRFWERWRAADCSDQLIAAGLRQIRSPNTNRWWASRALASTADAS